MLKGPAVERGGTHGRRIAAGSAGTEGWQDEPGNDTTRDGTGRRKQAASWPKA
ncbi:hypothetical protein [Salmonella enterica]|uniref:hypothetical protein n=1 Tax=Salmonella enterica TaxID=28901 RepID=UPI0016540BE8|nr:hypothetical protein [Salmonella enterica]MBC7018216.1 hypothetical protein [Salmonella enterica subsp. enterica serovar Enteritidis]